MVSIAVIGILMLALGSVVVLAGKAVPSAKSASRSILDAQDAAAMMASELRTARTVTELTSSAVTFTVADRDGNGSDETIRYYWAGSPGSPAALRRVYNGAEADLLPSVSSFSLTGDKTSVSTSQTVTSTVTSSEMVLASFLNYASGTTTINDFSVQSSASSGMKGYCGEYFVPASVPLSATKLTITRVAVQMKQYTGGTQASTIEIHKAAGGGSQFPASAALGTPFSVANTSLGTGYGWVMATFSDVNVTSPTQDFCIVIKGPTTTTSSYVKYLSNSTATADTPIMIWSINGGSTWQPTSNTNRQDVPFYVYGTYDTTGTTTQATTTYFLQSVSMTLCAGTDSTAHVDTQVATLNQPQVTGP